MQKVPIVMPSLFAKITAITSMPSMAPPKRIVNPLPTPEIIPPNKAHKNKSCSANGDAMLTLTGNMLIMRKDTME